MYTSAQNYNARGEIKARKSPPPYEVSRLTMQSVKQSRIGTTMNVSYKGVDDVVSQQNMSLNKVSMI